MDLDGTRVIVTGASTGIGRVTALRLARRGARVFAAARDERRLEALAAEHPEIVAAPCDVADDADRAALVKQSEPVDVLVNNAGLGWKGMVEDMPPDKVRQLFDVNVLALIDLTQRVLPGMLERGRGHVVNVGSIAGYVSAPGETVYCATKFAVQGFTDGLRREVVRRGVDVTLIAPGPIKTEFMARIRTGEPAGQPGALDYGLPPESVAKAIERALTRTRVPGYRTITVPRIGGFSRLGAAPGLARATDLATRGRVRKAIDAAK
jgi:short-subunit dehydrogenase